MNLKLLILFLFISTFSTATHAAVIIALKGSASILMPKKKGNKSVLFEGKTYSYKKARVGLKLSPRQIVKCDGDCKMKVGFANGDTFTVGPGSAIEIPYKSKKEDGPQYMNIFYGKLRAIVSQRGPNKQLRIKSKTAVTGVRGTDLFTTFYDSTGHYTSVIRGEVDVAPIQPQTETALTDKKVIVKSGQLAKVAPTPEELPSTETQTPIQDPIEPATPEVRDLNKAEVSDIVQTSAIEVDEQQLAEMEPEEKKQIEEIQQLSRANTLEEIKEKSPELYEQIDPDKTKTQDIHTLAANQLKKEAKDGDLEWDPNKGIADPTSDGPDPIAWWNQFESAIIASEYIADPMGFNRINEAGTGFYLGWHPRFVNIGNHALHGRIGIALIETPGIFPGEGSEMETLESFGLRYVYDSGNFKWGLGMISIAYPNRDMAGPELSASYKVGWGVISSIGLAFSHLDPSGKKDPYVKEEVELFKLLMGMTF
ncbi:MAG: hypothetical protein CL677_02505 [Bdellovibrionaceae bacterium]|nr:hypothetical protein [Pseudobdellovibrionaceae bacterium]|tara:strand:+ start:2026 stop:3468 length:1443 start_codon:yes stop_codon:yes gene_type:complete